MLSPISLHQRDELLQGLRKLNKLQSLLSLPHLPWAFRYFIWDTIGSFLGQTVIFDSNAWTFYHPCGWISWRPSCFWYSGLSSTFSLSDAWSLPLTRPIQPYSFGPVIPMVHRHLTFFYLFPLILLLLLGFGLVLFCFGVIVCLFFFYGSISRSHLGSFFHPLLSSKMSLRPSAPNWLCWAIPVLWHHFADRLGAGKLSFPDRLVLQQRTQ